MKLYLATGNAHKAQEFESLLAGQGLAIEVLSAKALGGMPDVDENASDFAGNAQLKAKALFARDGGNVRVLADDSGLCVEALGGGPGIKSARYAGEGASDLDNCEKLLHELAAFTEPEQRSAWFQCTLCLLQPGQPPLFFEGRCEGYIAMSPHGNEGFGYDPLFVPRGYEDSLAALGQAVKEKISHRAGAVARLCEYFQSLK